MQQSNGGPRIKLNRNAFKLEQGLVPKKRRLTRLSVLGCNDSVDSVHATDSKESAASAGSVPHERASPGPQDAHQQEPSRVTCYKQGLPMSYTSEPRRATCTLVDCNKNNNNNTLRRKQIRCHVHLALRFCGSEKSAISEGQQTVSYTVSRYVNRVNTSSSSEDVIEPNSGSEGKSVANQGVSRSGVNTEETRLGAPVKKDGQAACLRSNFNRKAGLRKHFGSISRLGSGRQVKRSVKNACCALCGDVKYTPPAPKKLAHACKAGSRHPSQPRRLEQSVVYPVAQAKMTTRLIIWFRRHLKVKLCDIAHVFDVTSRDFSCILPAVLLQKMKHKKVKCFSKEFRSLIRLDSQGSGNCGKWIGNQSWEVCTTTNSCASLSSGNQVLGFSVGDWKLDVAEDIEGLSESSNKNALRMPDCERNRLSPAVGTACVLLKPGAAQHCIETADYGAEGSRMASEVQEDKTAPVHRVPPLFLRRVHACNGISSSQHLQHVDLSDKYIVSETDTSDRCLVENGLNARPEGEDDCPDCFSCQRTTAYVAKPQFSCARTYRSWPFPRNGHSCKMIPSVRTGPRWIVNIDASEGTNYVIDNMQVGFITTSEYSVGKNMKESVIGFEPHDGSVLVQNSQGLVQSTTQFDQVFDSATPKDTSKDQSEGHKNPVKDLTSVSTEGECTKHNCTVFQQDPSSLGSVHVSDSQPVEVMNTDTLMVSPVASSSTMDIKYVDLADSSINRAQSSMSSGCLEDNENGTENPLPDLQQSTFQTSHIQHSREEPQAPTVMVHYSVEPKPPSSMMSQSNEEQICDPDIENRSPCSLNILYTNTTEQSTSSRTCTGSSTQDTPFKSPTNRDFLSSSDKDFSSMCPAERPEEGATECSLLQDEMRKIDKANRSPSPPPIPEGSVVTGNDLDVMRAYEDDAIVLDVIQDDPDLFGDIAMSSEETATKANPAALQRGKNTCMQTDKTSLVRRPGRIVWGLETKRKTVQTGGDVHVENNDDFCRGEVDKLAMSSKSQLTYGTDWAPLTPVVQQEQMVPDFNNNLNNIQTADLYVNTVNPGWTWPEGDAHNNVHSTAGKDINIVRPSLPSYCRYYFSEHHTCLRSICWFLHAPRKDDEKFCMDIVQKFCCVGNPPLVQRAVEIFVSYYRASSPAVSFSENVVKQLLSSLLSLALLKDLVVVINTLLTHKRLPPPELVIALYEHVRERGTINFVPELIHLTSKITEAGCVFSVEQCEMMQLHLEFLHVARHQMDVFCAVKCRALATNPHTAELSELAQAVVRVELCKQQEDWHTLAHVFCTVCGGRYSAGELSRFCCCVTMALLKDTKDKLTLPYEQFAESVWQEVPTDEMIKSFLGRVGVSLMFKYYRAQDWTKGLKLLYVMDRLQMEFTMLKGLFSSENGASRCQLITIATEFFINSGSIEGALNLLKANEWFVSSSVWPCDQADLQNRRRVLTLLADKTSYRDTLEVLTNLPGLKQPVDGVQASEYNTMFNAHLRRCVMSHVLPVGADTLEFMLTQGIQLDTTELQQLIHKLGKQNSWSRARTLFKRAYSAGYYSGVVWEEDSLALPCCLTEIEMTLAFEMFVACICTSFKNPIDSSRPLIITLKRRFGHEVAMESVYLAAGCRLLSAALIPNPKLNIRYTAASQEQEQLFNLDRGSAAKWFSHNRSWARGLWENSHTLKKAKTAFQ